MRKGLLAGVAVLGIAAMARAQQVQLYTVPPNSNLTIGCKASDRGWDIIEQQGLPRTGNPNVALHFLHHVGCDVFYGGRFQIMQREGNKIRVRMVSAPDPHEQWLFREHALITVEEAKAREPVPVDWTKPLFTDRVTLACPSEAEFDRVERQNRGHPSQRPSGPSSIGECVVVPASTRVSRGQRPNFREFASTRVSMERNGRRAD